MFTFDGVKRVKYKSIIPNNLIVGKDIIPYSDLNLSSSIIVIDDYLSILTSLSKIKHTVIVDDYPQWEFFKYNSILKVGYTKDGVIKFNENDNLSFIQPKYIDYVEDDVILVVGNTNSLDWITNINYSKLVIPYYNSELIDNDDIVYYNRKEVKNEGKTEGIGIIFVDNWEEIEKVSQKEGIKASYIIEDIIDETIVTNIIQHDEVDFIINNVEIDNERNWLRKVSLVKEGGVAINNSNILDIKIESNNDIIDNKYKDMIELAIDKYLISDKSKNDRTRLRTIIGLACILDTLGPLPFNNIQRLIDITDIHTYTNLFWDFMTKYMCSETYNLATNYPTSSYFVEYCSLYNISFDFIVRVMEKLRLIESEIEARINDTQYSIRLSLPLTNYVSIANLTLEAPSSKYTILGNYSVDIFKEVFKNNELYLNDGGYGYDFPLSLNTIIDLPLTIITDGKVFVPK